MHNLTEYKKFYIRDENHWYVSKIKQITPRAINQMAQGLKLFSHLLSQTPNQKLVKKYESFRPEDLQSKLFDITFNAIKVDATSKLFLSLELLISGLIVSDQLLTKNQEKFQEFSNIVADYEKGKNFNQLLKKYKSDFLTDQLEIYYRNFESWLSKFGFIGRINDGDYIFITDVGTEFINHSDDIEYTSAIFANQIKKLQVWNPTLPAKYKRIKVKPYYAVLDVITRLNDNKISNIEYTLFVTKIKSHSEPEINHYVRLIKEFRKLNNAQKTKYIQDINRLDKKYYPSRARTKFAELKDSSSKEIYAYTFGSLYSYSSDHHIHLINKELASTELHNFKNSPKFIEFNKKEDWVRHLGSLDGLNIDEILDLYLAEGKSKEEILETLNFDENIAERLEDRLFEREIESYYEKNISKLNKNFVINKHPYGRQYATPIGPIDILCIDNVTKEYVVIEFKRAQTSDDTIGQILRYMGYIYLGLNKGTGRVRGMIVGSEFPDKIMYALQGVQSKTIFQLIELFTHPFNQKNRPTTK